MTDYGNLTRKTVLWEMGSGRAAFGNKQRKGMTRMKFIIAGRNLEVTPGLRSAVEDKIGKLEKYFNPDTEVHVTLSVEKDRQKIEVTIPVKGNIIRSEQVSNDMYVSIDLVEEIIERQLKKYKTKIVDKKQAAGEFSKLYMENDYMDDEEIRIVRTKKFDIKPMYPEDACIQMELLGHNFFVFINAETEQVNVVYKRKGDTYGLIEPEV
jgi:putative sigma-54 modulation protein